MVLAQGGPGGFLTREESAKVLFRKGFACEDVS